jgi:hypothetical protein
VTYTKIEERKQTKTQVLRRGMQLLKLYTVLILLHVLVNDIPFELSRGYVSFYLKLNSNG